MAEFGDKKVHRGLRVESHMGVQIAMIGGHDIEAATGSAFLWGSNHRIYLITNLHNLSGWNWEQNRALSPNGCLPDQVRIEFRFVLATEGELEVLGQGNLRFDLFEPDGQPKWFVHPEFKDQVDVAILDLGSEEDLVSRAGEPAVRLSSSVANSNDWVDFSPSAGDDVFVLGFPKGMNGGHGFPIWKRGSIASEPDIDLEQLPKLLIDTATRSGMSGALVIACRRGFTVPKDGGISNSVIGESLMLLGIYSGRIGDDEMGVQLGIVWKAHVIDEILAARMRGKSPVA